MHVFHLNCETVTIHNSRLSGNFISLSALVIDAVHSPAVVPVGNRGFFPAYLNSWHTCCVQSVSGGYAHIN